MRKFFALSFKGKSLKCVILESLFYALILVAVRVLTSLLLGIPCPRRQASRSTWSGRSSVSTVSRASPLRFSTQPIALRKRKKTDDL